jgi:hypothetical protein
MFDAVFANSAALETLHEALQWLRPVTCGKNEQYPIMEVMR